MQWLKLRHLLINKQRENVNFKSPGPSVGEILHSEIKQLSYAG